MRNVLPALAEAIGAALIVAGLALVAVWAALICAGMFLLLAARAAEPQTPRMVRR